LAIKSSPVKESNAKLLVTFSLFSTLHDVTLSLVSDRCRYNILQLTYCYLIYGLLFGQKLLPLVNTSLHNLIASDCDIGLAFYSPDEHV
jgi:hypothetical protein